MTNTDNPDKPRPLEKQTHATGVYKGDELDSLLKEVVDVHADCIWSYDTDDNGGHASGQCKSKIIAWHNRQLAERLQAVLDSLPMTTEWEEDIAGNKYDIGIARNKLRGAISEVIKELMPKEAQHEYKLPKS